MSDYQTRLAGARFPLLAAAVSAAGESAAPETAEIGYDLTVEARSTRKQENGEAANGETAGRAEGNDTASGSMTGEEEAGNSSAAAAVIGNTPINGVRTPAPVATLPGGTVLEEASATPVPVISETTVVTHQAAGSNPTFGDIAPWALLGVVAGCVLGAVIWSLLQKKLKIGFFRKPHTLKAITLQGQGARENQQDSLAATDPELYQEQGALLCVADGMGGLQNGSLVSRTAVTAVINTFSTLEKTDPERVLAMLLQSATAAVNMVLSPNLGSGGTTLLIGYAFQGRFYCTSVGDSRICLLRDGKLIHLNRPHILEDELLLRYINGEINYDSARNYGKKGGLTSYLGMGPLKYVDFPTYHVTIQRGDRFILMSDGVFNTLTDEELARILCARPKAISTRLNRAIEKKQSRFQDNYSAAVLIAE